MRARLGLDIPLWQQYLSFLWNALTLDFGKSFVNSQSVSAMIGLNLPYTIELTIVSTIIGTIAAGQPIPVPSPDTWQQYDSETVHVPPDRVGNREHVYALRVKGDSMIDALVNDGDIVIMQKAETAKDGEMVAAWLKDEQEATLKRFYHEGDRVRLQPANSTMAPIYTSAANIQVQGKVIHISRDNP